MTTTAIARKVALATQDAYSYDRYGANAWLATAKWLAKQGLTERQIEAMLRIQAHPLGYGCCGRQKQEHSIQHLC